MFFVLTKMVCQDFFLVDKPWSRILPLLYPHAKEILAIMVETFISLEMFSSIIKVKTKTFIALDGPIDTGEGIIVLIEGHTPTGIVPGFSCPMDVPPNPPYVVATSKASIRDDYV